MNTGVAQTSTSSRMNYIIIQRDSHVLQVIITVPVGCSYVPTTSGLIWPHYSYTITTLYNAELPHHSAKLPSPIQVTVLSKILLISDS